jgi:tetratricopeptide (TPR) repeat protein
MRLWRVEMRIIQKLAKQRTRTVFTVLPLLIGIAIGFFGGIWYQRSLMKASAIGFWMTGVQYLEKGDYDYALFYLNQAIGLKNDDPFFYHAIAEAHEAKCNIDMALEFYKLELEQYKRKGIGPLKKIESKIQLLQEQTKGSIGNYQ